MKNIIVIFGLLISISGFAQHFTINGYVEEEMSGEKLIGANIFNKNTLQGTITNDYGYYSLTQNAGEVQLRFSYVGYKTVTINFNLTGDTSIRVRLTRDIVLKEVVISDSRIKEKIEDSQMSLTQVPVKMVKSLPVLMGEVDIIKAVQLLPGVQSGTEGSSGIYVRGGGPDENLVLLDGVPVYNVNHLFGFFSVFHGDAINTVKLIKGGFPARYGGRLSSVLDVRMKEGNMKKTHGEGSIGIIASKITVEGPIKKDTASFIISARRTYIDILMQPFIMAIGIKNGLQRLNAGYYFYDMNAKFNYKFSNKSRLYVSGYFGKDKAYFTSKEKMGKMKFNFNWGNATFVTRYNYIINKKLFMNVRASYSRYKNMILSSFESSWQNSTMKFVSELTSHIEDVAATIDFDYNPHPKHYIRFGASETYHTFVPGISTLQFQEYDQDTTVMRMFNNIYAHELDAYLEDDFSITNLLKMNVGLHASGFHVKGNFYRSLQARISARYLINENLSLKASYATMTQYIHLLTNSTFSLPTDIWVPVTDRTKPMEATQYAAGVFYNYEDNWEFSIEAYYKELQNVISFKEGASYFKLFSFQDWQDMITTGKGWAYGIEIMAKKNLGKVSGWVGYTLAWANRQFNGKDPLNFGAIFPYQYDRRHDLSLAFHFQAVENIDLGLVWVLGSGYPSTLYTQQYLNPENNFFNDFVYYYENPNNFRLPVYHRLDFGINFHKKTKWGKRIWKVGAYNAYNRLNPTFMYPGIDRETGQKKIIQISLFPIIPYVAYAFKF
jgi:outer membrane receptor for ferrienterochelin and colicin